MNSIKFRAQRIDNIDWVEGLYFQSTLTTENFESNDGKNFFDSGATKKRHCIVDNDGVVYEIKVGTLYHVINYKHMIEELKKGFSGDASYMSGVNDGMFALYRKLSESGIIK